MMLLTPEIRPALVATAARVRTSRNPGLPKFRPHRTDERAALFGACIRPAHPPTPDDKRAGSPSRSERS